MNEWKSLKEQAFLLKKAEMSQKIHDAERRMKVDFRLIEQRLHAHGERLEIALRGIQFVKSAG
jgi:stearoyl-CoA desaturase (delta-9 desaturase)